MKRFIDIGTQIYGNEGFPKNFAFYCTVKEEFESFNGCQVWHSIDDFRGDYLYEGATDFERYVKLIPEYFL